MKRLCQQSVAIFLILSIMIGTVGCKKAKKPGTNIISEKDPFFDVEEVECQIPVDESNSFWKRRKNPDLWM